MPSEHECHILRLEFETPVRFGSGKGASGLDRAEMTVSSDSIISALCIEWINLYGSSDLDNLIAHIQDSRIAFTSLLPWKAISGRDDSIEYYLPRPFLSGHVADNVSGTSTKKLLKRIPWIASSQMDHYLNFVRTGQGSLDGFITSFGSEVVFDRVNTRTDSDPEPYKVAAWQFMRDERSSSRKAKDKEKRVQTSGLYMIVQSETQSVFDKVIRVFDSLGHTGIGGKTSSGLGKFSLWHESMESTISSRSLSGMLADRSAPVQMLLGTISPSSSHDLEILKSKDSRYLLVSRSGFPSSPMFRDENSRNQLKRKNCVLIKEGSCFPTRLTGQVLDLSYGGLHPVYRVGKSLQVGLRI